MDELLYEKILSGEISLEVDESIINEKTLEEITATNEMKSWMKEMSDDEVDSLFPQDEEMTEKEAQWLFGDDAKTFSDSLASRRKTRFTGNYNTTEKKAANNPVLRDPDGGLTAAGRAHFNKTEGSNLKPGVKGPADTPDKMRRKGSFLARFFTNPRGPMKDEKGRPTRLALSASAWGEPIPQTAEAAQRLAEKGQNLLARYRRYKEAGKGKKSLAQFDYEVKELGAPVGQQGGTVGSRQPKPAAGASQKPQTISGRGGGSSSSENYNPEARDMDGDGNVQEGTEFMRAAQPRPSTTDRDKRSERADKRPTDRDKRSERADKNPPPSTPVVAGNIDLSKRKPVTLPSGEQATIRSMSVGFDDGEVLIPTIGPNGENWDPDTDKGYDAAVSHYKKTGQHLGKFKTPDEASAYGEWLHNQEAERIGEATDRRRGNAPRTDDRANPPASAITDITMPKADIEKAIQEGRATRNSDGTVSFNRSRVWDTESGSADTRERAIIRDNLEGMGFDGEAFRKLIDAESRKLKPGQKTNWNPGRLPNGGKIAADGTYIPPDMVREDDKKASDYYRERRERRAKERDRLKITREGDVLPDKNRDRIPPKKTTTRTGSADSMERNTPKAPRTGTADSMERNAPRTPRSGTADSMERNAPKAPRTGTADSMERNAPRTPRSGSADSMERNAPRTPRSGSADAQERRSEAEERRRTGKGQGFDKIESEEEMNTYRNSYLNPKNKPRSI